MTKIPQRTSSLKIIGKIAGSVDKSYNVDGTHPRIRVGRKFLESLNNRVEV